MASDTHLGKTKFIENRDQNTPLSRYNKIRLLINPNNIAIQETWEPPTITKLDSDRFFEVTIEYAHRPDLIALLYYGTEQLYWVIARANGIIDAYAETTVGRKLRIPDRDNVFLTVLAK